MNNLLIKVLSFALSFSLGVVLLCTTVMASQVNIYTVGDEENTSTLEEISSLELFSSEENTSTAYAESSSYDDPSSAYSSEIPVSSDIPVNSDVLSSSDIQSSSTDELSSVESSSTPAVSSEQPVSSLPQSSAVESVIQSSSVISEVSSVESYYYQNTTSSTYSYSNNNGYYNEIYSNVEIDTRSEINGSNWSDIDLEIDSDGKTNVVAGVNNKGDFSIFKKPAKQANITWLMYVAIALIIIGLSGMTYVYFSIRRYKKAFAVDDASYDEEIDEV